MQADGNSSGFSDLNKALIGHHPDLRCGTNIQHTQFCGSGRAPPLPATTILPDRFFNPDRNSITNLQSTHQVLGPLRAHTITQFLGGVRVFLVLELRKHGRGGLDERTLLGRVFPCEDQGGRGITVAVAIHKALLTTDMYICVDRSQTAQWRMLLVTRV